MSNSRNQESKADAALEIDFGFSDAIEKTRVSDSGHDKEISAEEGAKKNPESAPASVLPRSPELGDGFTAAIRVALSDTPMGIFSGEESSVTKDMPLNRGKSNAPAETPGVMEFFAIAPDLPAAGAGLQIQVSFPEALQESLPLPSQQIADASEFVPNELSSSISPGQQAASMGLNFLAVEPPAIPSAAIGTDSLSSDGSTTLIPPPMAAVSETVVVPAQGVEQTVTGGAVQKFKTPIAGASEADGEEKVLDSGRSREAGHVSSRTAPSRSVFIEPKKPSASVKGKDDFRSDEGTSIGIPTSQPRAPLAKMVGGVVGVAALVLVAYAFLTENDVTKLLALDFLSQQEKNVEDSQIVADAPANEEAKEASVSQGAKPGSETIVKGPAGKSSHAAVQPTKANAQELPHESSKEVVKVPLVSKFRWELDSKNRGYFFDVEKAIVGGDPRDAVRAFKHPLLAARSEEDKITSRELEGRYYLLVGKSERAASVLSGLCASNPVALPSTCIHYARALVSSGQYAEARKFFERYRSDDAFSAFQSQFSLMIWALSGLETPSVGAERELFNHFYSEMNLNAEWYRQRTDWMVKVSMRLPRKERVEFFMSQMQSNRENLAKALEHAELLGMTSADPLLVPFLKGLFTQYEVPSLGVPIKDLHLDNDRARLGDVFSLFDAMASESPGAVIGAAQQVEGRAGFRDVGKIMSANVSLNEGDVQGAWQILKQEISAVKARKSVLMYDWFLVGARCVALGGNVEDGKNSLRNAMVYVKTYPELRNDLHFWLLVSRLERLSRARSREGLARAKDLSSTEHDRGLIAIEEAKWLVFDGKKNEASRYVQDAVRRVPNHPLLLQAAVEILPQVGLDPTMFLVMQSKVPPRFAIRNQEFPLLSDLGIGILLNEI
jgi:hypothetical protein